MPHDPGPGEPRSPVLQTGHQPMRKKLAKELSPRMIDRLSFLDVQMHSLSLSQLMESGKRDSHSREEQKLKHCQRIGHMITRTIYDMKP